MTERTAIIKERMFKEFEETKEWWGQDTTILTNEEVKKEPLVVRKALAIKYVLNNMPLKIREDELIVGTPNMCSTELGKYFPEYALPDEKEYAYKLGFTEMSTWGHFPANYEKMLQYGLEGYRKRIYAKLKEELAKPEPTQKIVNEYHAMLVALDGVQDFAKRYSDEAMRIALETKDEVRRNELLTISEMLTRVPMQAPRTFYEALQTHMIIYMSLQSCMELVPAARADQYLYPFFKKDMEEGRITEDEARDLLASWFAKFNDRVQTKMESWEGHVSATGSYSLGGSSIDMEESKDAQYYNPELNGAFGIAANSFLMNIILAGQTPDGRDATNELSYLMLEVWNDMELVVPVVSVRFHKNSPQKLYETCADILRSGSGGDPALYNDEPIIEGLQKLGIPLEEARDYSNDGCWEILIPGRTDFTFWFIEVLQLIEYTLFRGRSLLRDRMEGIDTGDPCKFGTYEEFYAAFLEQLRHTIQNFVRTRNQFFDKSCCIAPDPLMSVFMDDCIEKGLDITNDGARYVIYAPCLAGLANCIDSLASVKKMVYEDKVFTMEEMLEALRTDFEGKEAMRQQLINWVPKFGNDDDYVDNIAVQLMKDAANITATLQEECPRLKLPMSIGTFERYASIGWVVAATPDGRHARETVGANYSPAVGRDKSGPTAVLQSISKPDLSPYINGCPVDIQMNANEVSGEQGLMRMEALIRSFMDLGGLIFTITSVSEEELRDAKIHPENHKSLRVRIGGYSGYFVALPPMHQDVMIERIRHGF